jgi:predicted transcriptional regulator
MGIRDKALLERRVEVVDQCIAEGKGLKEASARLNLSPPGLSQYLDSNGYKYLRERLGKATRIAVPLDYDEHVRRLRAVVKEGSQAGAARSLGISAPAMSKWLKDNGYGPDYVEDLEELLDDD